VVIPQTPGGAIVTRSLAILLAAAAAMSIPATRANAACTWTYQCSPRTGQCVQIPVCTSVLGVAPPPPPHFSPIPPPTIQPIPGPVIPPVGTRQCRQAYLCNAAGQCTWRMLCQ
jgi:hypothetical protein